MASNLNGKRWPSFDSFTDQPVVIMSHTSSSLVAEKLFPVLLDNLPDHVLFIMDVRGQILTWTPGVSRILGYEEAEFVGQPGSLIFTPEDKAQGVPEAEITRATKEGRSDDIHRHVRKDGSLFWASGQLIALYDEGHALQGFAKLLRDDTPRKTIEDTLRRNESRQTFLLQLSDALRPLTDSKEILAAASRVLGEYVGANRVGYAEAQEDGCSIVVTRNYTNGVPGIEGHYHYDDYGPELLREFMAGRTVVRCDIANDPTLTDEEKQAHAVLQLGATLNKPLVKGGRLLAVLFVHYSEAHNWSEEELALLDETAERTWAAVERARIESVLRQSEERLQKAISIETVGVLFFNLDGSITSANQTFERLSGYKEEELRQITHWEILTSPEFVDITIQTANSLATQGVAPPYEKQLIRPDGSRWWGLFAPTRLSGDGNNSQCVEFIVDITQTKLAAETMRLAHEKAEQTNRIKDEFLATLSHELRTPLNAILGWSNLLRTQGLDAATTQSGLEAIERNARSQAQLIEDLLDVSRILTGKLRLELRPVEMSQIAEEAVRTAAPTAGTKQIRLTSSIDHSASLVSGDPERLSQILWNLLSNAIKFTPQGGRVTVSMEVVDSQVQIQVSDTGQGISAEFLPHVFERFRQADASSTRKQGGLGIGLGLVYSLVEVHGGTVKAESPGEGQGSTFTLTLPLLANGVQNAEVLDEPKTQPESAYLIPAEQKPVAPLSGLKLLVVDDEEDARTLTSLFLTQRGAKVTMASSAAAAFALIEQSREEPFDALVSDVGMPEENGLSLMKRIRAAEEETGGFLPSVALTAYAGEQDRTNVLLAGFQVHAPKPVNPVELVATVANLTGRTIHD